MEFQVKVNFVLFWDAKVQNDTIWSILGTCIFKLRSNLGLFQVQSWSNSGPIQIQFRFKPGSNQVQFRSNLGLIHGSILSLF